MKFTHKTCVLLLCGLFTTPAFAQKGNLPKAIINKATQKAATTNVPSAAGAVGVHNGKMKVKKVRSFLQQLLQTRAKNAATDYYKDVMLFRLYDKEYGIIPAINDFMHELIKSTGIVQHGPISSFQSNLSPKETETTLSPATVRNNLLQAERRFQKADNSLQKWKPLNFKITPFTQKYGVWDRSWWIEPYFSGEQDIVQLLSFRHRGIRDLYLRILAWAHGEGKFPFSFKTVSQILELNAFSDAEYDALYNALNSSGCNILRNWGWTNADIRQFIKIHKDVGQVVGNGPFSLEDRNHVLRVAYYTMDLRPFSLQQLEYVYKKLDSIQLMGMILRGWPEDTLRAIIKFYLDLSTLGCLDDHSLTQMTMHLEADSKDWLDFWNFNIEQSQPAVLRIQQKLQGNH